jgi:basic membrane protein A
MRRDLLFKVLALVFVFAWFAAACGDDDDGGGSTTSAAQTTTTAEAVTTTAEAVTTTAEAVTTTAEEPAAEEPFRVALFSPGTSEDLSWSNAWDDGAQLAAAANPLIEITHVELLNEPDAYVQQGSAFAEQGFDFILFAHGAMVDPGIEVATNFPDTQVCVAPHHPTSDEDPPPDNLCWIDIDQHNANFLAGVVAALVTETGSIGSINGFAFPALTRQPEGFHLGARCVNPDIDFSQEYINTWVDTALAKAATQALIAGGADVINSSTDSAVLGIIDAAQEADSQVWVVPAYYDSVTLGPDVVLTSAVHGLAEAATAMIERAFAGEIGPASFHSFDATNNPGIIAAPLYDNADALDAESQAIFDDIDARVRSGEIVIPDETEGDVTIGAEGSAADIDVESIGCTPK